MRPRRVTVVDFARPMSQCQTSSQSIPVVWSPDTRLHDPRARCGSASPTVGTETAARVDAILRRCSAVTGWSRPPSHDRRRPDRVHDAALLEFLRTAPTRWRRGPYDELVGQDRVVPYLFPTPAMTQGLPATPAAAVHADAGRFGYDTMTLVGPGTWEAARAAVDCAAPRPPASRSTRRRAAAPTRSAGRRATTRPAPGYGGSCYLNNAAVAAEALRARRRTTRSASSTSTPTTATARQAIFYDRGDVLYGSVHVDPGAGWFPHVVGYADETGAGDGDGATRNLPLAPGTGDAAVARGRRELADWVADGAATRWSSPWASTPRPTTRRARSWSPRPATAAAGGLLGALGLPTVVVQEGGYHLRHLGALVAAYLDGHG